jgi:hypothetical protein
MGELDRSTLFANEAFVVGMLQAVSGAAVIAAISNYSTFKDLIGKIPFLLFFTAALATLALAVLAAYFRHQYKMWDVKAADSESKQKEDEANERWAKANCYLAAMRRTLFIAVIVFMFGLAVPIACVWAAEFYKPVTIAQLL